MNFDFSEDHRLLQEMVRKFAIQEIEPIAGKIDAAGEYPRETIAKLADLGLLGVVVPEKYGGAGMDFTSLAIVVEEVSRACASHGVILAVHNSLIAWPIVLFGTEEQRQRFLPGVGSGATLGAFALTEPEAGSDAGSLRTRAVPDGDAFILTGSKLWITSAVAAGLFLVAARTEPKAGKKGISLFLVERGAPGLSVGKHEDLMGVRATGNGSLSLEGVRVPAANMLGEPNQGFPILMSLLDTSRIDIGAQAVGIAGAALDYATRYARERVQFGKPISEHQMIQQMLAEMATEVDAARLLVYRAGWLKDSGAPRFTREAAMAKVFASETAVSVTRRAVQILGGYGYSREYPVERYYRDAKVTEIYEGTSQIQKMVIARLLLA